MPEQDVPRRILPMIVAGQVLATSLWFAPNAVLGELQGRWDGSGGAGLVTTAVQLGFIVGTLVYAFLGLADRYAPTRVFRYSALAAAGANLAVVFFPGSLPAVLAARFGVGLFLAGVYPVGMKIAASWYRGGLGRALGYLVGALVLGTASPHLLAGLGVELDWRWVLGATSLAAGVGGLGVGRLPEGPYLAPGGPVRFRGVMAAFRKPGFRAAALGYFGHMWELYAFWAFLPVWLVASDLPGPAVSLISFGVIAAGALGCVAGGYLVPRLGGGRVALTQLAISGACCLISPLVFGASLWLLLPFLLLWGITVAGDSPQFSALSAGYAPQGLVGSALTLATSLGFAVTIASLTLLEALRPVLGSPHLLMVLALGPAFGLVAGRSLLAPLNSDRRP